MPKENTRLIWRGVLLNNPRHSAFKRGEGGAYETSLICLSYKNLAHNISEKAPDPKNQHICHIGCILDNTSYSALKKLQNRHISVGKHPIMKIKALYFLQLLKLKKRKWFYFFGLRLPKRDIQYLLFSQILKKIHPFPKKTAILNRVVFKT